MAPGEDLTPERAYGARGGARTGSQEPGTPYKGRLNEKGGSLGFREVENRAKLRGSKSPSRIAQVCGAGADGLLPNLKAEGHCVPGHRSGFRSVSPLCASRQGQAPSSSGGATDSRAAPVDEQAWDERWFGQVSTHIVGAAHYEAKVTDREEVSFEGKKVMNASGQQLGWFPKEISPVLSQFVSHQGGSMRVEGVVPKGAKNKFKIPLDLQVYGQAADVKVIKQLLEKIENEKCQYAGLVVIKAAAPDGIRVLDLELHLSGKEAEGHGKGLNLWQLLGERKKGKQAPDLSSMFEPPVAYNDMPSAETPPGLRATLLEHQSKALAWMVTREEQLTAADAHRRGLPCIWTPEAKGRWRNQITNTTASVPPRLPRGGILADDMGMGKTMTVLGLLLASRRSPTLVVCPLSLLQVWEGHTRTYAPSLSVHVYHGPKKGASSVALGEQDVVVTTYATAVTAQASLCKVPWLRIVLDEAHEIRNPKAVQSVICRSFQADARWCITGTPLFNGLKDVFGLVAFLRIEPFNDHQWWRRMIERPAKVGNAQGFTRLRQLLGTILLRRTKELRVPSGDGSLRPVLHIPAKVTRVQRVPLSKEERALYDRFYSYALTQLNLQLSSDGAQRERTINALCLLTQLRQLSCSVELLPPTLVSALLSGQPGQLEKELAHLDASQRGRLLQQVVEAPGTECSICCEALSDREACFTPCLHVFHKCCLLAWFGTSRKICPLCNGDCCEATILPLPDAQAAEALFESTTQLAPGAPASAKLDWAASFLEQRIGDHKVVVFSHSVRFLQLLASRLCDRLAGRVAWLRGDMAAGKRAEEVEAFQHDAGVRVILCSVRIAGVGITLTSADTVLILDPWWNKPVEDQAIDRVHRIGQTRPVEVVRLVAQDTVEEQMLTLQNVKSSIFDCAMSSKASEQCRIDIVLNIFRGPWAMQKGAIAKRGAKRTREASA